MLNLGIDTPAFVSLSVSALAATGLYLFWDHGFLNLLRILKLFGCIGCSQIAILMEIRQSVS